MSNAIFKEISMTPQIFQKEHLLNDERKFERLLNILDNLLESGQVVGVFSDWFNFINDNISQFGESDRIDIEEILKKLNDRQRIVQVSNLKAKNNDEHCWANQALKINAIRTFEIMLGTKDNEGIRSFDKLDRKTLKIVQNKGAAILPQSKENMRKLLSPILAYAEIVKIYDPYFNLSKQRYNDALKIIAQTSGYKHGVQEPVILEINTSIKIVLDKDNLINWKLLNSYDKNISQIEKLYGHNITISIWEDKKDDKWHDRWIVTNQCAITLGKGSDISEWTESTWGILDYEQISNVEKKFYINRSEFNLVATVDKNGYKKKNKSKNFIEKKSLEEIKLEEKRYEEKLKKEEEIRLEKVNREPKKFFRKR